MGVGKEDWEVRHSCAWVPAEIRRTSRSWLPCDFTRYKYMVIWSKVACSSHTQMQRDESNVSVHMSDATEFICSGANFRATANRFCSFT